MEPLKVQVLTFNRRLAKQVPMVFDWEGNARRRFEAGATVLGVIARDAIEQGMAENVLLQDASGDLWRTYLTTFEPELRVTFKRIYLT